MNPFLNIFELPKNDENVFNRMRTQTQIVKFGLFNFVNVGSGGFRNNWLGSISEDARSFKLYRVRSTNSTSDFVLRGRINFDNNKTSVRVFVYPHFYLLLGYVGVFITVYFITNKMEEMYGYPNFTSELSVIATTLVYTIAKMKDFVATINAFQNLIDPINDEMEKRVYRD